MIRTLRVRLTPSLLLVLAACAPAPVLELVPTGPVETSLAHGNPADVWVDMIAHARTSIDLAEFYASNAPGSRLEPVVQALEAAVRRGVHVRFLAEASFVEKYPDTLDRLAKAGAEVRHLDLHTGGILHAKYFVVDGTDAFLGSQNFDWRALEHNLELGVRIHDRSIVLGLEAIFDADWDGTRRTAPASPLTASPQGKLPAGIAWDVPALVKLLDSARHTIHVELLVYKADFPELDTALRRAAARGVDVELAVSDWEKPEDIAALAGIPHLRVHVITIPKWSGGDIPYARVAHAKLLVVDGKRAWLGTSNWSREYFFESRNVGLLVDDPAVAVRIDQFFVHALRYAR